MSQHRIGVYPGTFDPLTLGHLDIIRRGAHLVDCLVIGVTTNPSKEPMFTVAERLAMVRREIDGFILNRMQAVLLSEAFRLVGEGYCTAEDLDKTIAHGLGLRWSFMGPFETIEMNAPGGIPDYCARFSKTMAGLASRPYTGNQFEPDNVAKVMASWGRTPTAGDIAKKSRWRDERLATLVAHKKAQKTYIA